VTNSLFFKVLVFSLLISFSIPDVSADSLNLQLLSTENIDSLIDITATGGNIDIIYNGVDLREQIWNNQQAIQSFLLHSWYERSYHDLLEDHEALDAAQWNFTNQRFTVAFNEFTGVYSVLGLYRLNNQELLAYTDGNTTIIGEINKNTQRIEVLSSQTDASLAEVYEVLGLMESTILGLHEADLENAAMIENVNTELGKLEAKQIQDREYYGELFQKTQTSNQIMLAGFCVILVVIIFAIYGTAPKVKP